MYSTMALLKKEQAQSAGLDPSSYALIVQAINKLSDDDRAMLRSKFDIVYFLVTENLPSLFFVHNYDFLVM